MKSVASVTILAVVAFIPTLAVSATWTSVIKHEGVEYFYDADSIKGTPTDRKITIKINRVEDKNAKFKSTSVDFSADCQSNLLSYERIVSYEKLDLIGEQSERAPTPDQKRFQPKPNTNFQLYLTTACGSIQALSTSAPIVAPVVKSTETVPSQTEIQQKKLEEERVAAAKAKADETASAKLKIETEATRLITKASWKRLGGLTGGGAFFYDTNTLTGERKNRSINTYVNSETSASKSRLSNYQINCDDKTYMSSDPQITFEQFDLGGKAQVLLRQGVASWQEIKPNSTQDKYRDVACGVQLEKEEHEKWLKSPEGIKAQKEEAVKQAKAEKERLAAEAKAEKERAAAEAKAEKERVATEARAKKEAAEAQVRAEKEDAANKAKSAKVNSERSLKNAACAAHHFTWASLAKTSKSYMDMNFSLDVHEKIQMNWYKNEEYKNAYANAMKLINASLAERNPGVMRAMGDICKDLNLPIGQNTGR